MRLLLQVYYNTMIKLERRFDLPAAIFVGEEMVKIARQRGDWERKASAHRNLSRYYGALNLERQAALYIDQAIALYEKTGNRQALVNAKMSRLEQSLKYRSFEEAIPEMNALLASTLEIGDSLSANNLHTRMVGLSISAGLYDEAFRHIEAIEKIPISADPVKPAEYGIVITAALGRADIARAKGHLARNYDLQAMIAEAEARYEDALGYTKKKHFHEKKFKEKSAGFDVENYYLQQDKKRLEAESKSRELELSFKKRQLLSSFLITLLLFLLAAGLLIGLYKQRQGKRALARQNALIQEHSEQLKALDAAKSRFFDFSYDIAVPEALALNLDREKCRQILYNLLSNAFKFTPEGGKIEASLSVEEGILHLSVADSGPGIHPNDLPRVFDRFFQTSLAGKPAEGGTGIGLNLCQEYARLLGGEISVESALGQGAAFRAAFPVSVASSIEASLLNAPLDEGATPRPTPPNWPFW